MDYASMNAKALRAACKGARISYGSLDTQGMRDALVAHAAQAWEDAIAAQIGMRGRWSEQSLLAMGEFGSGVSAETAECPHCGINHIDNGHLTPDDEGMVDAGGGMAMGAGKTLHQMGLQHAEHACMGCNGEWGQVRAPYVAPKAATGTATGTGLKIEKDRVERNGVKRPSVGGLCRAVWDWCDAQAALGLPPTGKGVKAQALVAGWNGNNATIELYQWRKWSKPTQEEGIVLATAPQEQDPAAPQQDATIAA